jgi:hypothetical protein
MSYELIKTSNGPIIKYGDAYITAQEIHSLLEIAETDASFIPAFKTHIIENLRLSVNEMCEAFEDGMSHMSPALNSYMNASFMFNNFINGPWANYKRAKADGGFQ